jgi:hypothetical protein
MTGENHEELGRRAANHVFCSLTSDYEALEIFIELIKEADLDTFRAHLLECYAREEQEFEALYPGQKDRSLEEHDARWPGERARRLREAGR